MKTIKFRAWDTINKRWATDVPFTILTHTNNKALFELQSDGIEWIQYTGLKSNGQEWYEGDILENDSDWYQVEWDNDEGRWLAVGIGSTHESIALCELVSSETFVQGNIYQNPELLK